MTEVLPHGVADLTDRYLRQREIIPPAKLAACRITVIGVGAIGRQVSLQLAAMGAPWLQLVDHDVVEMVNLAPQGYFPSDLGLSKVTATGNVVRGLNPKTQMYLLRERFRRSMDDHGNVVFVCVDAIDTRRMIWESLRRKVDFFCDGRMSAEVLRVLTVNSGHGSSHYPTTLFSAADAFRGSCTAKSTIFCANIAAGMMVAQFAKWLRGMPTEADLTLNLLSAELSVA